MYVADRVTPWGGILHQANAPSLLPVEPKLIKVATCPTDQDYRIQNSKGSSDSLEFQTWPVLLHSGSV